MTFWYTKTFEDLKEVILILSREARQGRFDNLVQVLLTSVSTICIDMNVREGDPGCANIGYREYSLPVGPPFLGLQRRQAGLISCQ